MKSSFDIILQELYSIDPALQADEKELIPLLKSMMQLRPDAEPNAQFVEHLRIALREKTIEESHLSFFHSLGTLFSKNYALRYTLTGIFLGAVMMTPLTYSRMRLGETPTNPLNSTQKLFSYSVEDKGSNAFGTLSTNSENIPANERNIAGSADKDTAMSTRPQSGGGGPSMMATEYRFLFPGTLPALSETVQVLKRVPSILSVDLSTLLTSLNTGPIDLSSLKGARAEMITFYQDVKYGYGGSISFRDGTVSLHQNYEQWPHPENECRDEACYERYRLTREDIPSDETLKAIAGDFVQAYGLNLTGYGAPEVDQQWQTHYAQAMDTSMVGVPDTIRVVYPLMIDGKEVYEEGGMKSGMSIGVNIREKKVSDVFGMMNQQYQTSAYAGVTDEGSIRSYLTNYGAYPQQRVPIDMQKTIIEVTLGEPEVALVRVYTYEAMQTEELLVPALVFPITNIPSGASFYGTSITIPLAKELFDQRTSVYDMPTPMPLMEDVGAPNV